MFGGAPLRVRDADRAAADLQHAPRGVAELEDVAGHALDGEVLVERADERLVRFEDDAVVGDSGIAPPEVSASSRDPRRPRTVPFTSSRWSSAARRPRRVENPSAAMRDDRVEVRARQRRDTAQARAHQLEELVLGVFAARALRDDLLRQHVERRVLMDDGVELAAADRAQQRRALDQVVAR